MCASRRRWSGPRPHRRQAALRWAADHVRCEGGLSACGGSALPGRDVHRWVSVLGGDPLFSPELDTDGSGWRVPLYSWLASAAVNEPGASIDGYAYRFIDVAVAALQAGAPDDPGFEDAVGALVVFARACLEFVPRWERKPAAAALTALAPLAATVGLDLDLPGWVEQVRPETAVQHRTVADITRQALPGDELLPYLQGRLGDDPQRWALALTLAETWTATLEDLVDTVAASQPAACGG